MTDAEEDRHEDCQHKDKQHNNKSDGRCEGIVRIFTSRATRIFCVGSLPVGSVLWDSCT